VPPSPHNDPVSTTTTTITTTTITQEGNTELIHDDPMKQDVENDNSRVDSDRSTDSSSNSHRKVKISDSDAESNHTKLSTSGRTLWDRPWSPDDHEITIKTHVTEVQNDK